MLNQVLFEKIYVSCSKEVPLEIEEQYNPPFNVIIEPFKEELAKLNRSILANSEAAPAKIATAKNRILSGLDGRGIAYGGHLKHATRTVCASNSDA